MSLPPDPLHAPAGPWQLRLRLIVETMREMSEFSEPQAMNRAYRERLRLLMPTDGMVSLSRRHLPAPQYRITRASRWAEEINPWKEKDRLPLLSRGLLGELLYSDEPKLIDNLEVSPDDPAHEYLDGYRSLIAIPMYDRGRALNMVVLLRRPPRAFRHEQFPEIVWLSNLYGRATHSLVYAEELRQAYQHADDEMKKVGRIQRSLLPPTLPTVPTLGLAAHYQTSQRAGGDYYDLFPLKDGRCGILIADVSGHGTPAAVMMAVTHAIAHTHPGEPHPPGELLNRVNRVLASTYTGDSGTFVTAFYGVYDPATRSIRYANAGHPLPRLKRCADGSRDSLDGVRSFPLGIDVDEKYPDAVHQLQPGDQIVFCTDGILEAMSPAGEQFGLARLDEAMAECPVGADNLMELVLTALDRFTDGRPADDDRTLLVAKVS